MAGHVACVGKMRNAYKILAGKPEGNRPLGRPMHRWNNIRMDLKEIVREGVDWVHVAQDRDQWWDLVNTIINLWVPLKAENVLIS